MWMSAGAAGRPGRAALILCRVYRGNKHAIDDVCSQEPDGEWSHPKPGKQAIAAPRPALRLMVIGRLPSSARLSQRAGNGGVLAPREPYPGPHVEIQDRTRHLDWGSTVLLGCSTFSRTAIVVAVLALSAGPASAQGFFNWFGGGQRQQQNPWSGGYQQRQYAPPQGNAYSDPSNPSDRPIYSPFGGQAPQVSTGTGRAVSFCVRTCDGRYFPIQRHANASPVQLCSAFCPAAKTQVFNGSQIDQAVGASGARYADLDNAFVYRQKIVEGCTCNGKDSFGLARIDVANDPTLRQGDIVANGDNVKAALIAMAAAKERGAAREQSMSEKPAVRNGMVRRVAGPAVAAPREPSAEVAPGDQTDSIPED